VTSLARDFDVRYDAALVERPVELGVELGSADALIVRNRTQVDAALLAGAPRLKVIGRLGVGLYNIDLPACEARRIDVIPATGANARSVAEYVIGAALGGARPMSRTAVAAGEWPRAALAQGRELSGSTLGVVGFGSIGRLVAELAHRLGMHVIGHDPAIAPDSASWPEQHTAPRSLDDLLRASDIVSLHVPLTKGTHRLLDARRLSLMKRDAILINTSRGGIVDEAALAAALRGGTLGGAALDVFEREPLPAANVLAGCPGLLLTPHIAGVTRESNARVSALAPRVAAAPLRAWRRQRACLILHLAARDGERVAPRRAAWRRPRRSADRSRCAGIFRTRRARSQYVAHPQERPRRRRCHATVTCSRGGAALVDAAGGQRLVCRRRRRSDPAARESGELVGVTNSHHFRRRRLPPGTGCGGGNGSLALGIAGGDGFAGGARRLEPSDRRHLSAQERCAADYRFVSFGRRAAR
jgi:(S)-sulfolactate dehydrogenase